MRTILWIEDDYERLKGLVRPLEKSGIKVDFAVDTLEYRKKVSKRKYDLFIVDLILPQKSEEDLIEASEYLELPGLEIISELSVLNVPIIVLSVVQDSTVLSKLNNTANVKAILAKGNIFPSDFKYEVFDILGIENDK